MHTDLSAIYWKLHSAYLRNDQPKAKYILGMLLDSSKGREYALLNELGSIHSARFLDMKQNITNGTLNRIRNQSFSVPLTITVANETEQTMEEREFCRRILWDSSTLLGIIGVKHKTSIVSEVDMKEFGRCDFLVRQGRRWIVIEAKMGDAPSDVVSQIDRYRISAELDMCMGLHDHVDAFVLAGGFPKYVSAELSRAGVGMIQHEGDPRKMKLVNGE